MKIGIILVFFIIVTQEIVCTFKRNKSQVLFDAPIMYKLKIAGIFMLVFLIVMIFIIGKFMVALIFVTPLWMGCAWIVYDIYKVFFYKKIIVNIVEKEVLEEVVYKTFQKYDYELEEIIEYGESELVIKNIGSSIVIKENKKDKCTGIEISKYKKIKHIDEIVMNMKKLLIEEYKVEKDFNIKKSDFLDPIIFLIIWYGLFIVSDMYSKKFNPLVGDVIFPTIFPIIVYGIFKIRDKCFKES
ncbi:hypothetical protein IZY60_07720 [Lutibacter sp. B2]|nr:hypothetical protein [Lutibacter sp. B2]